MGYEIYPRLFPVLDSTQFYCLLACLTYAAHTHHDWIPVPFSTLTDHCGYNGSLGFTEKYLHQLFIGRHEQLALVIQQFQSAVVPARVISADASHSKMRTAKSADVSQNRMCSQYDNMFVIADNHGQVLSLTPAQSTDADWMSPGAEQVNQRCINLETEKPEVLITDQCCAVWLLCYCVWFCDCCKQFMHIRVFCSRIPHGCVKHSQGLQLFWTRTIFTTAWLRTPISTTMLVILLLGNFGGKRRRLAQ